MTTASTPSATSSAASAAQAWRARRVQPAPTETGIKDAWERFLHAADRELTAARDHPRGQFPHITEDGRWQLLDANTRSSGSAADYEHGNWTAGFRPGVAWLHAVGTRSETSAALARDWLQALAPRAVDHTTHDLGFLFFPSIALPDLAGREVPAADLECGLQAARTLAARWNPRTGLLQAFGSIGAPPLAGTSTIDTLMNLPLLWWAAVRGEDPVLYDVARRHARTSARLYLRPDASTCHLLHLDPISGAMLDRGTFQGQDDNSCWSRGQAWAVCGLAWAYAACGEFELLEAAERAAAYFFDHLPDDGIPPWDFTSTSPIPDASASAAAALGCLLLAHAHRDGVIADSYAETARMLLADLTSCINSDDRVDGILLHSTYSLPHQRGVDGATGFGDFYVGLALACAVGAIPTTTLACVDARHR